MDTNNQGMQEIRNSIIKLFNIGNLPPEKQEETITRIGNIIFQAVLVRVLPSLSEENLAGYEKLVDGNPEPDVLFNFFFEKVPDFLQIVTEESENFRKESEEVLKNIK